MGPGKDTHGTPVPKQWGRPWVARLAVQLAMAHRPTQTPRVVFVFDILKTYFGVGSYSECNGNTSNIMPLLTSHRLQWHGFILTSKQELVSLERKFDFLLTDESHRRDTHASLTARLRNSSSSIAKFVLHFFDSLPVSSKECDARGGPTPDFESQCFPGDSSQSFHVSAAHQLLPTA